MSRPKKTLEKVLRGGADANFAFRDICGMLEHLGFQCRIQGSHWIYEHPRVIGIDLAAEECEMQRVSDTTSTEVDRGKPCRIEYPLGARQW